MFKKAKRANFRRRNESDEDEQEESRQQQPPPPAQTSSGPVVEEIPFMETSSNSVAVAPSGADSYHSNGFQAGANSVRAVKKEKKGRDSVAVPAPGPTKASLLSFNDEEGNLVNRC